MATVEQDLEKIAAFLKQDEAENKRWDYSDIEARLKSNIRVALDTQQPYECPLGRKGLKGDVPLAWQEMEDPRFSDRYRHVLKVTPRQDGGTQLEIVMKTSNRIDPTKWCVILIMDAQHRPTELLFPKGCGWREASDIRDMAPFDEVSPLSAERARQAQYLVHLAKFEV
ncbi:MAG: hypothetical protein AB7G06_01255 [Bdellovibrionales bacterium]